MFRAIWNRIKQFWTEERWVRVTDDEKNARFVGVNTTKGSIAALKLMEAVKSGEIDQQTAQQYAMQLQSDPSMMEPANSLAEMDVDIQIDEVADAPTLQIEQFEQLVKLAPMTPPQYLPTMFELMIEASSLRNKDKLREIMEQAKKQDPQQDPMQQLQMAGAAAQVEKTKSEVAKNYATAEATAANVQIDAMQAGVGMAA
jgi:Glucosamine-6-phosphate isomerases/6-phosphogluconolactonase